MAEIKAKPAVVRTVHGFFGSITQRTRTGEDGKPLLDDGGEQRTVSVISIHTPKGEVHKIATSAPSVIQMASQLESGKPVYCEFESVVGGQTTYEDRATGELKQYKSDGKYVKDFEPVGANIVKGAYHDHYYDLIEKAEDGTRSAVATFLSSM